MNIRAALAESANRDVDEVRFDLAQRLLTDTHPLDRPGAEVLDEQVGAYDEALEHLDAL